MYQVVVNKPGYLPDCPPQDAATLEDAKKLLTYHIDTTYDYASPRYCTPDDAERARRAVESVEVGQAIMLDGFAHTIVEAA